jgi:hypothetical protein
VAGVARAVKEERGRDGELEVCTSGVVRDSDGLPAFFFIEKKKKRRRGGRRTGREASWMASEWATWLGSVPGKIRAHPAASWERERP